VIMTALSICFESLIADATAPPADIPEKMPS
jgi:hypothetical protein